MANNVGPPISMPEFTLENWMPMEPAKGPPLPSFLGLYWPWYKPALPTVYTCPTCGAQFSTEAELLAHIEAEHPEAPPVVYYTCSVCGTDFATEAELTAHILAEHPEELLPIELRSITASPEVVTVGDEVTITVKAANPNPVSVTLMIELTGAIQSQQEVTIRPRETKRVSFIETVTWEGYKTVYCAGLSVLIKGEKAYPPGEPIPPGAYHCPYCVFSGDSSCEVGTHIAEVHFGYTYPAGTLNEAKFCGMGVKLCLYDLVDPNPELLMKAHWAMGNIVSGELLWRNLNARQRTSLRQYLEARGEDLYEILRSYGTLYWRDYVAISEIAPGWSKWLLPPEEEAPPPEAELRHRSSAWGVNKPLPDCFLGISDWEILDPKPYQSEDGRWFITIHAYYYVWSDTGELVYPCTVSPPDCEWVVSSFAVGTSLYKDSTNMGTVTLIENLGGDLIRVTAGGSSHYFIRMMTSVGYGFAWCDKSGAPYLK